ncbi:4'-phosphopantetheinyl transferase family protein [Subtercola boreus]|nr:4'-phosphopantetheinyl transferase superfamily protein [Subtercola boreus]
MVVKKPLPRIARSSPTLPETSPLQYWLGSAFAVAIASPEIADSQLFREERAYIAGATENRREEFGAVRVCARRALASLDVDAGALVPNGDRSPSWPEGVIGSLAHCRDLCIAVVTTEPHVLGVGIDVETCTAVDLGLESVVCTETERRFIDSYPRYLRDDLRTMIFCAKEAVYKCQYPITKFFLDFLDIEITIAESLDTFVVAKVHHDPDISQLLSRVGGSIVQLNGFTFAVATLTASMSAEASSTTKAVRS